MRTRSVTWTLSATLVLGATPPAAAQLSVSPFLGAMMYDGSVLLYEDGVYTGSGIDDRSPVSLVGLRVGYALPGRSEVELSYGRSWLRNQRGVVASHVYHVMGRYPAASSEDWALHLALGAGGITYRSAGSGSLSDPTLSGGLGYSHALTERLDFRTDLTFLGQLCSEAGEPRDGLACNDGSQLGYAQLAAGVRVRL